jgi:hypothetical protein
MKLLPKGQTYDYTVIFYGREVPITQDRIIQLADCDTPHIPANMRELNSILSEVSQYMTYYEELVKTSCEKLKDYEHSYKALNSSMTNGEFFEGSKFHETLAMPNRNKTITATLLEVNMKSTKEYKRKKKDCDAYKNIFNRLKNTYQDGIRALNILQSLLKNSAVAAY